MSNRSATDFAMALIATIVQASQRVYADEYVQTARTNLYPDSKQGVSSLSLQQHPQSHGAAEAGSTPPPGSTPPAGILAGKGPDIFALAVHSAAACTEQQHGASSTAGPGETATESAETHCSSAPSAYPTHELEVGLVFWIRVHCLSQLTA